MTKNVLKKSIYVFVAFALLSSVLLTPIFASAVSRFSLRVSKDDADNKIRINLVSSEDDIYFAIQGNWTVNETNNSTKKHFSLSVMTSGNESMDAVENNIEKGKIMWLDMTANGVNISADKPIWSAVYEYDKYTPPGTYTFELSLDVLMARTTYRNLKLVAEVTIDGNNQLDTSTIVIPTVPSSPRPTTPGSILNDQMGEPSKSSKFVDILDDSYYIWAIDWAVNHSPVVTSGVDSEHFSPDNPCTRAQTVTFLWRAAGEPEPSGSAGFGDVAAGSYYEKAVAWAVEQGITAGTGENTFSPEDTVSRAQVVTFLYRLAKGAAAEGGRFSDVPTGAYYADAVNWAVGRNVTSGTSDTTFSPNDPCTRAQIVTFLYRYYGE